MLVLIGIAVIVLAVSAFIYGVYVRETLKIVLSFIIAFALAGVGTFLILKGINSESFKRWTKDIESEYNGGLYRSIQVVDKDGNIIKEYKGKMDIQETSGDKIVFVMDGRKYIIYNNSIFNTIFVEELEEEDAE